MAITTTESGLLRLLQLSSASLPVGGYSFSQGLETAIDCQWLNSAEEVGHWLSMQLQYSLARVDLPLLLRLMTALQDHDDDALDYWNSTLLACRETRELLLTDTAMGEALLRLLRQLDVSFEWPSDNRTQPISFVTAFALAAHAWQIAPDSTCLGLCWSWLENQVAAATKLVPLGQSQAQRLLGELQEQVPDAIRTARVLPDEELGGGLPGLAIASSWHETQYSRLFRS